MTGTSAGAIKGRNKAKQTAYNLGARHKREGKPKTFNPYNRFGNVNSRQLFKEYVKGYESVPYSE